MEMFYEGLGGFQKVHESS